MRSLVRKADVVVNNYRPGVMDKMGFGRDALRGLKPDIISCHVTGFGLDGPYASRPSFDFIAQAMSGFMSVNGDPNGPPMRAAPPISDLVAGAYAAMGILAALVRRARTGEALSAITAGLRGSSSGNPRFHLADQVGADVGALGENAAAKTGEDRDQRTAETQTHQRMMM